MPLPSILYKYRSLDPGARDYTQRAITNQELYFAKISDFNDPFEFRFVWNMDGIPLQWTKLIGKAIRQHHPDQGDFETILQAALRSASLSDEDKEKLASSFPKEIRAQLEKDVGILSLSAKPDDILMWSHYANNHKGICLGFTTKSDFFGRAEAVTYSENLPKIDYFNTNKEERARLVSLTKASQWSYEEEWRIIDVEKETGCQNYSIQSLTHVILGCRISEKDKNDVTMWLDSAKSHPKLDQAVEDNEEYKLRFEVIT